MDRTYFRLATIFDVREDVLARLDNTIDGIVDQLLRLVVCVFRLFVDEGDHFVHALPTVRRHLFGYRLHIIDDVLAVTHEAELTVLLRAVTADHFAG